MRWFVVGALQLYINGQLSSPDGCVRRAFPFSFVRHIGRHVHVLSCESIFQAISASTLEWNRCMSIPKEV